MSSIIDVVELLKILILSVIQGITEWLPISSTGHLILIEDLIQLSSSAHFKELFMVWVQLGSIFAVVLLYFHKLNPLAPSKTKAQRSATWVLWFKVVVASIPAMIFGLLLDDYMDAYLNTPIVVAIALIVYGVGFIWIERRHRQAPRAVVSELSDLTYAQALKIGCFQALSIIPGTSRSGSTIMGGLLMGTSRFVATEFSFFMSIPVMFGASFLKAIKLGFDISQAELIYLISGMVVAFLVSIFAIRFLLNYLKRHDFTGFGYYRIVLGVIVILWQFLG